MTGTETEVEPRRFTVARESGVTLVGEVWEPIAPVGGGRAGGGDDDDNAVDEILMLHGGAQTRHAWTRAARRLSGEGYRVTAMDARGHGDSDWDPEGDYDIHRMAEDLEAIVAERFAGRKPVIVGASLGGMTAMLSLGSGADVARALVLVDVTPRIEAAGVQRIGEFMRSGFNGFASLDEAAEAIAAYQPHRKRPPHTDGLRKNLRLREDGRWHWHWDPRFAGNASADNAEIGNAFFETLVPKIQQPTLLIRGGASDIVSDETVEHLLELLPHAYTMEVPEAGHMVAGDDNAVFLEQLGWFLTEIVGVSGE